MSTPPQALSSWAAQGSERGQDRGEKRRGRQRNVQACSEPRPFRKRSDLLTSKTRELSLLTLRTWLLLTVLTVLLPAAVGLAYLRQSAPKSWPVETAEAANEARLRRINESYLRLQLKTTQRLASLLQATSRPTRKQLSALLTACPSVMSIDWYSGDLDAHVVATRSAGTPIGAPITLLETRAPSVSIHITLELTGLSHALLDKLPPDNESVAALVDSEGLLLARHPADATLGQLPRVALGTNGNWLRQTGPLHWEKLRLLWLREAKLGIVVKRPVLRTAETRAEMVIVYKAVAGMLVITTLLSWWLTRPIRQLQQRLVAATDELVVDADWSHTDPSDELEVIETAFATLAEHTLPSKKRS
jgi:hypothetical protein